MLLSSLKGKPTMRRAANFLSLATFTALLVPALQVSATAVQRPSSFKETRFLLVQTEPTAFQQPDFSKAPESLRPVPLQLAQTFDYERQAEANSLLQEGNRQYNARQFQEALLLWQRALEIYQELGHLSGEATTLYKIGTTYSLLGNYPEAIEHFEQGLPLFQLLGDQVGEADILNNLGLVYSSLGNYPEAIEHFEQGLPLFQLLGDQVGEADILNNLGLVYYLLGNSFRALEYFERSLALTRESGDQLGEATTLANIGSAYLLLRNYSEVLNYYQQSLSLAREMDDQAAEALTLGNIGSLYGLIEEHPTSLEYFEQSLSLFRDLGDRASEVRVLGNIGIAYQSLENYSTALEYFEQSLFIKRELDIRAGEARTLGDIGKLLSAQAQPELAIIFLKASVEVHESIRGDIRELDVGLQQSYTDTVADDYRLLADLLLQQDRIIEAQRVLDLLKVQELDDYLDDVQRNAQTETGVEFWQPEEDVLALYEDVLLTGTELQRLQALDTLTPDEQARLAELEAQQDVVYTSFIDWLDHPQIIAAVDQLRAETRATVDIGNFTDLQASLRQLPQTSVILYPLVLEDRLELVLVSADAPPVRYPIEVDALELNRTVVAFGQALKDRRSDPRELAQQLYEWVIAPLENDLAAVGAEHIIFAPDGVLRYVPLTALYDGEQWLAERFSFSQITAASEADFAAHPRDDRSLLAAACADCAFTVNVGDDAFDFLDLPATLQEVELLAAQVPGAEVLINDDFTPEQFKRLLGSSTLIHLATHGKFVSGAPDESFVLFGNGQTVNLRQMRREWSQLDADLVVLSACETALGSPQLGDGVEILGLGFQLQRVGAKAVMASLWQVSDNGTQVLMNAFYTAIDNGFSKAEALKRAQQALMADDLSLVGGEGSVRAGAPPMSRDGTSVSDAYPGYSHPYYWAPFILIGNGQ
ncbi:MAG: tetratricopeptide repeat protein [Leptolyngbya sp. SIO1E4]|nr:tetratricopeptide repeat protein [Leptolyngbya sp. SIO1E4]